MTTCQVDPQELALKLLFQNFADCDYRLGNEIISNVMVIWTSQKIGVPFNSYNDRPTFSPKAKGQKMLWEILKKWSRRYWEYAKQVEHAKVEYFGKPLIDLNSPDWTGKAKPIKYEILRELASHETETVIEIMAILIVECARRLNSSEGGAKDDMSTNLYYTDLQFQLA